MPAVKPIATPSAAWSAVRSQASELSGPLAASVTAIALGLAAYRWGMTQFGGFDLSPLVDLAWRLWRRQLPHQDFILTFPPFFSWVTGLSFRVLGPSWSSLVAVNAAWTAAMLGLSYWALGTLPGLSKRALLPTLYRLCGATYLALCAGGIHGFWWHNTSTSGLASLFVLLCGSLALSDGPRGRWAALVLTAAALGASKPNVALPALALGFVGLALAPGRARATTRAAVAGCILCLGALEVTGFAPLATAKAYLSVSGRGLSFDALDTVVSDGYFGLRAPWLWRVALVPLALAWSGQRWTRRRAAACVCAAGGWTAGLYSLLTNMEMSAVSLGMLFAGSTVAGSAFLAAPEPGEPAPRPPPSEFVRSFLWVAGCVVLLGAVVDGLDAGAQRERIRRIGEGAFWQDPSQHPLRRIESGFFAGLSASPNLLAALSTMDELRPRLQRGERLWLGPRLQFGYAYLGLESPVGFPLWWHPGSSHGRADEPRLLRRWERERFSILLHLPNDLTYYSVPFMAAIRRGYRVDRTTRGLWLFSRRPSPAAAPVTGSEAPRTVRPDPHE